MRPGWSRSAPACKTSPTRAGIKYQLPDAKGPNADDVANAATMTPAERQDMIKGMVGGLETRLMTDGGPLEDWLKLMNALAVLGDKPTAPRPPTRPPRNASPPIPPPWPRSNPPPLTPGITP